MLKYSVHSESIAIRRSLSKVRKEDKENVSMSKVNSVCSLVQRSAIEYANKLEPGNSEEPGLSPRDTQE